MRYQEMAFKGRIMYSRTFDEVEKSAEELLNFIEAKRRTDGHVVLGCDIEWRPTFRRGSIYLTRIILTPTSFIF